MKQLVVASLCVVLIASLGLRQAHHQFNDEPLFKNTLSGNITKDLYRYHRQRFSRSNTEYLRSNKVNFVNKLNQTIFVSGTYQASGKVYENNRGTNSIFPQVENSWEFVKTSGAARGSNGVVFVDLPKKTLVIYYENPWSNYNFAGVCIQDKRTSAPSKKEMQRTYDRLYKAHPKWPSNCALADNWYTEHDWFSKQLLLRQGEYQIDAYVQYQKTEAKSMDTLRFKYFSQDITVAISNA